MCIQQQYLENQFNGFKLECEDLQDKLIWIKKTRLNANSYYSIGSLVIPGATFHFCFGRHRPSSDAILSLLFLQCWWEVWCHVPHKCAGECYRSLPVHPTRLLSHSMTGLVSQSQLFCSFKEFNLCIILVNALFTADKICLTAKQFWCEPTNPAVQTWKMSTTLVRRHPEEHLLYWRTLVSIRCAEMRSEVWLLDSQWLAAGPTNDRRGHFYLYTQRGVGPCR